jgi:hypothetical protein
MIYSALCLVVAVISLIVYFDRLEVVGNPFLSRAGVCFGILFSNLATILSPLYWEFPGVLVHKKVFIVFGEQAVQSPWYGSTELNRRIIVQYGPAATTSRIFSFMRGNVNWKLNVEYQLKVTDPLKCSDATRNWMVGYLNGDAWLSYRMTSPEYFSTFPDRIFESKPELFTGGTADDVEKYVRIWSDNVAPPGSRISLTKFERKPQ